MTGLLGRDLVGSGLGPALVVAGAGEQGGPVERDLGAWGLALDADLAELALEILALLQGLLEALVAEGLGAVLDGLGEVRAGLDLLAEVELGEGEVEVEGRVLPLAEGGGVFLGGAGEQRDPEQPVALEEQGPGLAAD